MAVRPLAWATGPVLASTPSPCWDTSPEAPLSSSPHPAASPAPLIPSA